MKIGTQFKNAFRGLLSGLLLLTAGTSPTHAVPITVPTGLNPGDEYRLLYLTTATRDATSTSIAVYNAFVTADATATPDLNALGTTWTAVAGTSTVTARSNTGTDFTLFTGVPIYGLSDLLIAANNADLWDGSISSQIRNANGDTSSAIVNTGMSNAGLFPGGPLGANGITHGNAGATDIAWAAVPQAGFNYTTSRPFYAISGVLTVASVPDGGSTVAMLGLTLAGVAGLRRKFGI